jgi:hypothetical protein
MAILVNIIFLILGTSAFAQNNGEVGIKNLSWKNDGTIISDACVEDCVQITFDTVNISLNDNFKIYIFRKKR